MSTERFLSARIVKWRSSYFKTREAIILSISIGVIIMIINTSFVSLMDYDTATTNITCLVSDMNIVTMQVRSSYFCN